MFAVMKNLITKQNIFARQYVLADMNDFDLKILLNKMEKAKKVNHQTLVNYQKSVMENKYIIVAFDLQKMPFKEAFEELFPQGIQEKNLLMGILSQILEGLLYLKNQKIVMKTVSMSQIYIDE